jgi:hypothetical protein
MKYFQEDAQLSEKLDGLEPRLEKTQDTMVPDNFLVSMEEKITEDQRISFLDLSVQGTPDRW